MQNPNLLLYKPENMESALQLLNEECNNNEVLDSSWHLDEKQQIIVYQKIRELCKEESDTKIIYTRYREWFSNWKKENN
jgi:hypothetical protein